MSASSQSLAEPQINGILLSAAAIGAFAADSRRWLNPVKGRQGGGGAASGEYRRIGRAYRAALKNFEAGLIKNGLSPEQAKAFRDQAAENGSIASLAEAADEAVAKAQREASFEANWLKEALAKDKRPVESQNPQADVATQPTKAAELKAHLAAGMQAGAQMVSAPNGMCQ